MIDRYSRQTLFPGIGEEGQNKLGSSSLVIIGCGVLGSIISTSLVRAGVGRINIIDRDFIEYHNLQRQIIFDEEDIRAQLPKAIARLAVGQIAQAARANIILSDGLAILKNTTDESLARGLYAKYIGI